MTTFAALLKSRSSDGNTGLRFEDRSWTWAQVVQESADRAALIESWQAEQAPTSQSGQLHVGILLENTPEFVFWLGACALAGAAVVGINPTRRGAELAHDIRHTDCSVIITEDRQVSLLDGVDHGVTSDRILNVETPDYAEVLDPYRGSALPTSEPMDSDILLLLFSSGSTGSPKAVICSQGRLAGLATSMSDRTRMTPSSVTYVAMPLFHGNAVMLNFAPALQQGATVCLARKFTASGFSRDIHRYGVTLFNYVGRALAYVLAQPEDPRDRTSTLELAIGTEASLADAQRFAERFGCEVSEGYGLSEGVMRINRTPDTPPDALGLPVGGARLVVLDEQTGQECPPAELSEEGRLLNADRAIGQIVGLGMAQLFEGYYRNPGAMAERIRGEDFWTGDLAYRDRNGYFYFAGRSSDWLRVDSENFAAAPVERILQRWDQVAVALVYAVPDPRTGDQVMCTLQMAPGCTFDPEAFRDYLDAQTDLGTKWRPRYVRIVDEVPTTGNSKVAKTGLRRVGWLADDPVYHRIGASTEYLPFTAADSDALEKEFADNGRTALLPSAS